MILKLHCKRLGRHVHANVFMGPDADHLVANGVLVFDVDEYKLFSAMVLLGVDRMGEHLEVVVDFPDEVAELAKAMQLGVVAP